MKFPYKATPQRTFLLNSPITHQERCSLDNIENLTNNVYIYYLSWVCNYLSWVCILIFHKFWKTTKPWKIFSLEERYGISNVLSVCCHSLAIIINLINKLKQTISKSFGAFAVAVPCWKKSGHLHFQICLYLQKQSHLFSVSRSLAINRFFHYMQKLWIKNSFNF